jgi:hypothetical protein
MQLFLLGLLLTALTVTAAPIGFDFTSGGTNSGSSYGNVRTFTSGGVTVTVTAWGLTGGFSNTTFENARLGQWSGFGMGVCNREEGGVNCDSPEHQADNVGRYDFVLFQFSTPVDPLSITINPFGTYDRDVSYWTGNTASGLNLSGLSIGSLAGLGFGGKIDDTTSASGNPRTVDLTSGAVNSVFFGAQYGAGDLDDRFKIESMSVNAVPEPATLSLLGGALLALGVYRRRARK